MVEGRLFTGSYDGCVKVWDITGINDDTAFGESYLYLLKYHYIWMITVECIIIIKISSSSSSSSIYNHGP